MDDTTRAIETLIRESSEGLTLQEIAHNDKFRRVQTKDIQQKINLLRSKGRITQQKNSVPPRFIHDNRSLHAVITDVFLSATESPRMMGDENWGSKRALTSENDDNSDEDTEAEENNRSDKTTEEEDRDEEEDHDRVNDDDFENNVDADNGDRERQLESGEEENESEKSLNQQQVTGRQRTRTQELEIIAEQCLTNRIELIPSNVLLQVIKSKKSTEKIERTLEQCNGVQLKKWASDCCKSRRRLRNGKSFQNSLVEEQRAYIKLFLEVRHADMNREGTIWKPGPNLTEQVELLSIDTDEIATIEPINTAIENHWLQKIGKQPSSKKAAVRHSKKPKHKLVNIHSLGSFRSRRENNTLEGKMRKDSQWGVSIDQRSSDEIIGLNGLAEVFRSQGYKFVAPESNPREDSEPPEHESRATNVNTTIINFTFNSDKSGRVVTASQHIPQTAAINTVEDVESDHDSDKESTETDFELAISGITYKVKESHLVKPRFEHDFSKTSNNSMPQLQRLYQNWFNASEEMKRSKTLFLFHANEERKSVPSNQVNSTTVHIPFASERVLMRNVKKRKTLWSEQKERNLQIWEDVVRLIDSDGGWDAFALKHEQIPNISDMRTRAANIRKKRAASVPDLINDEIRRRLRQVAYIHNEKYETRLSWEEYCLSQRDLHNKNTPARGGNKVKTMMAISKQWRLRYNWPSKEDMTATHATQKKKAEALSEEGRYSPQYGGAGNRQEIDGVVHYADGSVFWVNEEDGNEEVMAVPSYEAHNLTVECINKLSE